MATTSTSGRGMSPSRTRGWSWRVRHGPTLRHYRRCSRRVSRVTRRGKDDIFCAVPGLKGVGMEYRRC